MNTSRIPNIDAYTRRAIARKNMNAIQIEALAEDAEHMYFWARGAEIKYNHDRMNYQHSEALAEDAMQTWATAMRADAAEFEKEYTKQLARIEDDEATA